MREGLRAICGSMGVKISEAALGLIASNADGSVRDALSLLDQCLSAGDKSVSRKEVLDLLGTSGEEVFLEMTELVTAGRTGEALLLLARVLDDGKDVRQFLKDWMEHYRNLLIAKYVEKPEEILNLSGENTNRLKAQAAKMDLSQIREGIVELSGASAEAKWSTRPRVLLELAAVRLSSGEEMEPAPAPRRERPVRRQPAAAPVQQEPQDLPSGDMPAYAEAAPADNLDDFWQGILAEGEKSRSSLHMLRVGSRMVAMNEKVFSIQAKSDTAYRYGEMYRRELEELMQKQTGISRKLEMLPPGQTPAQGGAAGGAEGQAPAGRREKTAEDLARELENQLGIHVEIQ
ncbi:MAG: hypothetical protein IJC68_05005 [Firmicutes bacterium]|nr:hypothetical protein [Bacillota bacterium]